MVQTSVAGTLTTLTIPSLENGDRLSRDEFERILYGGFWISRWIGSVWRMVNMLIWLQMPMGLPAVECFQDCGSIDRRSFRIK